MCSLGREMQFDRKHLLSSAPTSTQAMWQETCHDCVFHFSSQGWARHRDCLNRQHSVAPSVQMWARQAALFESILSYFLFRGNYYSLQVPLFFMVSLSRHVSLLDFGDECILFNLRFMPHPHSRVRMAPCGGGFSLKISKYLGNEYKQRDSHPLTHNLEIVVYSLRYVCLLPHLQDYYLQLITATVTVALYNWFAGKPASFFNIQKSQVGISQCSKIFNIILKSKVSICL